MRRLTIALLATFPEGWTVEKRSMQAYLTPPDGSASCLLIEDRLEGSLDESARL